jgi:glycosyltransferase involved in cell wall biosynthesis
VSEIIARKRTESASCLCNGGPAQPGDGWGDSDRQAAADSHKYSAMLATGEDVGVPLALLSWVRRSRRPVFLITHGSYFASERFGRLMRVLRRNGRLHFLCLSESLRRILVNDFGVRPENAHNTSYGVDTSFFHPSHRADDPAGSGEPLIVAAGTAKRDYRTLVEAAEGLDAPVHIAADSTWFREPVNIGDREVPPNVTIRSSGDYAGLRDLYARASFVVVPLRPARHACGYAVIVEAMAMGRAVICTKTESPGDFLADGETGFYVKPGDAEDLRLRMEALLCNPELAREMGRRGRARIEREFSLDAYCDRIESVIHRNPA